MANYCIYGAEEKGGCTFPHNWPLGMFICQTHLAVVYGIEVWYFQLEEELEWKLIGPFLRPAKGTYFRKHTVIFPERDFVDLSFVPEHMGRAYQNDPHTYLMNPNIKKYCNFLSSAKTVKSGDSKSLYRYKYEIVRNLSKVSADVNLGAFNKEDQFVNFKNKIQNNISRVENTIKNMSIYQDQMKQVYINEGGGGNLADINRLDNFATSDAYKVLFTHILYDEHQSPVENLTLMMARLPFNVTYRRGVGIVALDDIGHPLPLVISGYEMGTHAWYMNKISDLDKPTGPVKAFTNNDIRSFTGHSHVLRGGSDSCLM